MDANNENKQADSGSASAEAGNINVTIRTARLQKQVAIGENISIKDLRQLVADTFEVSDPILTVLIFGGKILKDTEDIKTHDIKDGQTIHLVIRNKPTTDGSNPTSQGSGSTQHRTTNTSASNVSASNLSDNNIPNRQEPSINPLLGDLGDVQQRLQQMLISNPETMQNMINPMMQQMMNNPNMMSSLFGSMQRMQMLMERNPEVNHLLSNPDVLRESLEMARNPAALQEVMRNYDRALNNMESMPGGYNVLRRMYTEFQEPLMSAFQEQFSSNQFSPQSNTSETSAGPDGGNAEQQRRENRDPLPNPWATPSQQTTTDNNIPNLRQDPSINPLLGNLGDVQQRLQQMLISNPETMQTMMQQMMSNPNMMGSLFGGMQRMQSLMEQNPEINQLLSNPGVLREHLEMARNPAALQEHMRNHDRAMNNMESMPGGFDALRRMYSEFQEPLMNAFQDQLGANLFSPQANSATSDTNANNNNNNNSTSEPQRTENRDPLPNPWADRSQQTTATGTTTTTTAPPDAEEKGAKAIKKEKKEPDEESKDGH